MHNFKHKFNTCIQVVCTCNGKEFKIATYGTGFVFKCIKCGLEYIIRCR